MSNKIKQLAKEIILKKGLSLNEQALVDIFSNAISSSSAPVSKSAHELPPLRQDRRGV